MESRNRQTNLRIRLESPIGRHKENIRRFHRIISRQTDASVIDALCKWRISRAANGKVPLEEIILDRLGKVIVRWLVQLGGLAH